VCSFDGRSRGHARPNVIKVHSIRPTSKEQSWPLASTRELLDALFLARRRGQVDQIRKLANSLNRRGIRVTSSPSQEEE